MLELSTQNVNGNRTITELSTLYNNLFKILKNFFNVELSAQLLYKNLTNKQKAMVSAL